ncbi:hypothetical protein JCM11251_000074 [Rhodosporidiobolus azoricus]
MSSADHLVAVPRHSSQDDDHALVLPGSSHLSGEANASSASTSKQSATAALSRALAGMLAFMFKRPIRLFRPVKISTWAGIQAIAEEKGRSVTPGFVRGLLRQEGWRFIPRHILPPLLVNTAIGLTLFTAYTTSETLLLPHFTSPSTHLLLIPFLSGAFAGAAQALLSAPLDNARLLLLRRQRFLRLSHAASSTHPRVRRSRLAAKTSSAAGGVPFVSWLSLLRDSVFQSSRNALGGSASPNTPRERLAQGRRWARRGWSLFNLSLIKDACGFGVFFLIFEVGREGARVAGLRYDGIDPDKPEEEGKQRRSASGLVLQSLGILISGGLAGWVFGLVARPFERMRGAVWEGRARWAERDGRLKVIEELALAGHDPLAPSDSSSPCSTSTSSAKTRRHVRRVSAGSASERKASELLGPTGRKEFRVRIGRIRTVTRGAFLVKRRRARQKEREHLLRVFEQQQRHEQHGSSTTSITPSSAPSSPDSTLATPAPHSPPPASPAPSLRLPMPAASSLVLLACKRYGTTNFLFAPRSTLTFLDSYQPQSRSASPPPLAKPMPQKTVRIGPTRLSARGRAVKDAAKMADGGGRFGWRRAGRVLSYVPPYAVGLLFYALTAGDLKIEV